MFQRREVLTDELESEVFVASRLFGVFVQEHDGPSDPAVLQSLLTDVGQLQDGTCGENTEHETQKPNLKVSLRSHLLQDPEQLLSDSESRQRFVG